METKKEILSILKEYFDNQVDERIALDNIRAIIDEIRSKDCFSLSVLKSSFKEVA